MATELVAFTHTLVPDAGVVDPPPDGLDASVTWYWRVYVITSVVWVGMLRVPLDGGSTNWHPAPQLTAAVTAHG